MSEFPLIQYMYNLWLYTLFQIYFHLFQVSTLAVKEDMTAIQLKSCLGLKSLIDFSLLFHLSDSFISSTLHLKPGNNIAAVISIVAACCCKGRFTQKRVHLTWTIWLSTSPFEERRGQNNCSLFGTFFDCNLRSATQVEWMWSGVCALHRLNYTITFHLPSDDFFFFCTCGNTLSFGKPGPSIDRINARRQTVCSSWDWGELCKSIGMK